MRVLSKRWPFVKTPGNSASSFYQLSTSERTAKKWFNRVREWTVQVSITQPILPSGTVATSASYVHPFTDWHANEKRRILAKHGINERIPTVGGGETIADPSVEGQFAICADSWAGIAETTTALPCMFKSGDTVQPMLAMWVFVFVEGAFADYASNIEDDITQLCLNTGRIKHSFTGTFAGETMTFWFASAASEPSPGPATWNINITPTRWFQYADKQRENPIYEETDGSPILTPGDYLDPLA